MSFETIIGLEVHLLLNTKTKLFSAAKNSIGEAPNSQANAIDLALPGALPTLNAKAVMLAIKFGLSINAEISLESTFTRKNYFYPDLPKGYQITQHELPLIKNGYLDIALTENRTKRIRITRAHLEEDAGKSIHEKFPGQTAIDFNRAGTPLIEVVSAPELHNAKEAVAYLKTLQTLAQYLEISSANLAMGGFRVDVNISLRKKGAAALGTRTEVKNLNSFRFVEHAINYEIKRQKAILEKRGSIIQETLFYDPEKNETHSLRIKEADKDYRYFPDPDLLPLKIQPDLIAAIAKTLPELPWQKSARFEKTHQLNKLAAQILTADLDLAAYFESTVALTNAPAKLVANWLVGELLGELHRTALSVKQCQVTPTQLAQLLNRIHDHSISQKKAKEVFLLLAKHGGDVDEIINHHNFMQVTDKQQLTKLAESVILGYPELVAKYHAGKNNLLAFFVGKVLAATDGKADPILTNQILQQKLKQHAE